MVAASIFEVKAEWLTLLLKCRQGGLSVLIIKDIEGYVYGGYASQPWERHADFYGDMKSFLFQLFPKASIFRPTGANHNLQWVSHWILSQHSVYVLFPRQENIKLDTNSWKPLHFTSFGY